MVRMVTSGLDRVSRRSYARRVAGLDHLLQIAVSRSDHPQLQRYSLAGAAPTLSLLRRSRSLLGARPIRTGASPNFDSKRSAAGPNQPNAKRVVSAQLRLLA